MDVEATFRFIVSLIFTLLPSLSLFSSSLLFSWSRNQVFPRCFIICCHDDEIFFQFSKQTEPHHHIMYRRFFSLSLFQFLYPKSQDVCSCMYAVSSLPVSTSISFLISFHTNENFLKRKRRVMEEERTS